MPPKVGAVDNSPKVYLKVPFSDKDEAKALGARWDGPNKAWYTTAKEQAKFAKWPVLQIKVVAPVKSVTPAAPVAPLLPPPELLQALGNKKDYTLVPPPGTEAQAAAVVPIPSLFLYKLKEKSTADLAKIIIALGVALPMGLDVEELIEILMQHPDKIHIDKSPAPLVAFKPLRELTEHELIMQKIKAKKDAEERAKRQREKGEEIKPEPGTGYVSKKSKPSHHSASGSNKAKGGDLEELSEEKRELLARIDDDDYNTIR